MDSNHACKALIPDVPVVLNIGLGIGIAGGRLSPAHRLAKISRSIRELMVDIRGETYLVPTHVYIGEPLLVVSGRFTDLATNSLALWDLLVSIEQDCIAIHYPTLPEQSILFGPRAEQWGEFNPVYFTQPKEISYVHQ